MTNITTEHRATFEALTSGVTRISPYSRVA